MPSASSALSIGLWSCSSITSDLTHAEAAESMGTPIGTARSRLHYALQILRAALDADARGVTTRGTA